MSSRVPEFPDWAFEVEETSAGVYKVTAEDQAGRSVEVEGFDPDELLDRCKEQIRRISSK